MPECILRCACGLPWARIEHGRLIVQSEHRGQKHVNSIAIQDLVDRACEIEREAYREPSSIIALEYS